MAEVSDKQLEANKKNAQLGGVKSEAGKNRSKYNAVKHNALTLLLTKEESEQAELIRKKLEAQFSPIGIMEELLVERMAVWLVRLQRIVKAESEQMKAIDDPRIVNKVDDFPLLGNREEVVSEGYKPKIKEEDVEKLFSTFFRYETAIEGRLYKTLRELTNLQDTRRSK